jgi:hypothetical protein
MPTMIRPVARYARYETISEAIQPIVTKHGFSLTFSEGDPSKENHIRVLCEVMHDAGHVKEYHADIPFDNVGMKGNANKTNTHAYGSTKSYGKRYLKCDIFDVALKNEDDDGNSSGKKAPAARPTISPDQVKTILQLLEETGVDTERFCKIGKIEAVPDMLASDFDEAVRMLQRRKAKMNEGAAS